MPRPFGVIGLTLLSAWVLSACVLGISETVTAPVPTETRVNQATATPIPSATHEPTAQPLRVVTSTPLFASMVKVVGGERVEVRAVMPPGTDSHTYQPSPREVAQLAEAAVVIYNGSDLEPWMERQLEAVAPNVRTVILSEGLEAFAVEEEEHGYDHEESPLTPEAHDATPGPREEHSHEHAVNPHFWLDPDFATVYIERIASALAEADPHNAATYQANAARYVREIRAFDDWAKAQIATIPPERRKLVTFHDAFPYFAAHYGLELVGVVVPSPGREPLPQEVANLVAQIRQQRVSAIFIEPQFNPKLAQTIAQEAGVQVLELYSDTLPEGGDYLAMMRYNVQQVVSGLRG